MSVVMATKKEKILYFIETYKSLPALWDLNNPDYSSKRKKAVAYDLLVEKMKIIEPSATREYVAKKINNIRSCFRKELKKVDESKKSGASGDSVYVPSLFYYKELLFLVDQEDHEESMLAHEETPCPAADLQSSITSPPSTSQAKKRKIIPDASPQNFFAAATRFLEKEEDEYMIYARGYAAKLKKLAPAQFLFADRLINEVLLEAHMGNLNRWSGVQIYPSFSPAWSDCSNRSGQPKAFIQTINSTGQPDENST